jgi:hypothetical protein
MYLFVPVRASTWDRAPDRDLHTIPPPVAPATAHWPAESQAQRCRQETARVPAWSCFGPFGGDCSRPFAFPSTPFHSRILILILILVLFLFLLPMTRLVCHRFLLPAPSNAPTLGQLRELSSRRITPSSPSAARSFDSI